MSDQQLTRALYGEHARHVPGWCFVQDQGPGLVALVGASHVAGEHPLRYGTSWTHNLIVGELIVRPHYVIGTNALRGSGAAGLLTHQGDVEQWLADGEVVLGKLP